MEEKKPLTKLYADQLNRNVEVSLYPQRIISLVPSQTELLFDLGLDTEVVGITKFCIHPERWFKTKSRIGGTKQFNFEKIKSLQPDLIIGNKEENDELQIKQLMNDYPVWMSDIKTLDDALSMIESIGDLVNQKENAALIKKKIEVNFDKLSKSINHKKTSNINAETLKRKCLYLIWYNPIMAAGSDTFISNMLLQCGLHNAIEHLKRYPVLDIKTLQSINPDYVFLSSEPFPFKQKHVDEMKIIFPHSKVIFVNGEYFSWYGSRLIGAAEYFDHLISELNDA